MYLVEEICPFIDLISYQVLYLPMKSYSTASFLTFLLTICSVSAQEISSQSPKLIPVLEVEKLSILRTAQSSEKYHTMLSVVMAADLQELLDDSGPFTVFAPSDLAFEKLSGTSLDDLMHPDNRKELKALMSYHIVAGKISASKILKALSRGGGKTTFTSLQGDIITATIKGIDIILSDSFGNTATIVVADANQQNGIIHEIDAVIRPQKL